MPARLRTSAPKAFIVTTLLTLASVPPAEPAADLSPPPPQPLPATGNCYYDNVYYGAVPPGGERRSVLVFVHGYTGLASDWWVNVPGVQVNDMYPLAYAAGYRTAFVNLNVDPGAADCAVARLPGQDMMYNGHVLSQQLERITQHYGVSRVDIVAHSKGGIDAQAAIVWWGAWPRVRNVFTIGTPHQGSLLADLLWSPEGAWLTIFLERDEATFSLRTAAMQLFRLLTDLSTVDDGVAYYTAAGNFWATPNTAYELTGAWLQDQPRGGDNDGAVTVASTQLLGAPRLFLRPWNHTEISLGGNAFPSVLQVLLEAEGKFFKNYLPLLQNLVAGGSAPASEATTIAEAAVPGAQPAAFTNHATGDPRPLQSNFILRGGRLGGSAVAPVPIEPQAHSVTWLLLARDQAVQATLLGPDGSTHTLPAVEASAGGLLASIATRGVAMASPAAGLWAVEPAGPTGAGYLLVVSLDSQLQVSVAGMPTPPISPDTSSQLSALGRDQALPAVVHEVRLSILVDPLPPSPNPLARVASVPSATTTLMFTPAGLYSISMGVSGETAQGWPFERTFIWSLPVVSAAHLADASTLLAQWSPP